MVRNFLTSIKMMKFGEIFNNLLINLEIFDEKRHSLHYGPIFSTEA
jgi:N-acetylmuramic acid 6-phosphate (MurNAc-6-P) etherase